MAAMERPGRLLPEPESPAPAPRSRRPRRPAQHTRDRVRRAVRVVLIGTSALLLTNALFGENGYLAGVRAVREHDALVQSIARLRLDNQRFLDETRRLEHDPATLEEVARRDHNLARPGEVLVIIRDVRPAAPAVPK